MTQGLLPIEYAEAPRSGAGVTALAGLLLYLDLLEAAGLRGSFARRAPTARVQGWSESQLSVAPRAPQPRRRGVGRRPGMLEQDECLGEVVRQAERHGVRRRTRRARRPLPVPVTTRAPSRPWE